jgi:hypothetical protein
VPTIQEALQLIEKDPVMGFVGIPILAASNSGKVVLKLRGRDLVVPDWNGTEWAWWGNLAFQVAAKQSSNNPTGEKDKQSAVVRLRSLHPAMVGLGTVKPTPPQVADYYDRAVRLVIASNAAASGPTRGRLAAEAFGEAFVQAPATIVAALKDVLEKSIDLFLKDMPRAAASILSELFGKTGSGLLTGVLSSGIGPIVVIGLGLWAISKWKE